MSKPGEAAHLLSPALLKMAALSTSPVPTRLVSTYSSEVVRMGENMRLDEWTHAATTWLCCVGRRMRGSSLTGFDRLSRGLAASLAASTTDGEDS